MDGLPLGCIHRSPGFALLRADGQLLSWGSAEQRRLSDVRRWGGAGVGLEVIESTRTSPKTLGHGTK